MTSVNEQLWVAASEGNRTAVRDLIAKGANVNHSNECGCTVLMAAAFGGHAAVVSELIGAGASPNHRDQSGWTALIYAANLTRENLAATVAQLLNGGADPRLRFERPGQGYFNALMVLDQRSIQEDEIDAAIELLEKAGCDRPPGWRQQFKQLRWQRDAILGRR